MEVKTLMLFIIFIHACEAGQPLASCPHSTSSLFSLPLNALALVMFTCRIKEKHPTVILEFVVCFAPTNGILLYHCVRLATEGISFSTQMFPSDKAMDKQIQNCAKPSSITHLNVEICNETTYVISKDAVLFLKGSLVTHFMPSFYIIIIIISLPLNGLALMTFTCRIRQKKSGVIYMAHLACVDLLFTLLLPLKIHYQLNASNWVFGEAACRVLTAAYYCYMYCSILLMMSMSVDRLLAVAFPVTSLTWRTARKARCICVLFWLLALAATVPLLSMTQTFKIKDVGVTCHDVLYHPHVYAHLFSILSCFYFFLPLVVTLVSYSTIIYVLSVKSDRSSSSSSDSRARAVIMAVAVLTEFVTCFAPTNGILLYHCVYLATGFSNREENSSYTSYLMAVCLGSSSVFLDPLLYYYGSSHYRKQLWSVLRYRMTKRSMTL